MADLIITGIVDGDLSGGLPKAVEFFALNDISDLSSYGFGSANNGGGSDGEEFTFSGSVDAGDYLYVASESEGFESFFGFAPNATSSATSINGDDAIELFLNGEVVDTFGEINVDGTGEPWEYMDGWAYRESGTSPDGSTFVLDSWTFSTSNALDGETSNATAETPFPIATFNGGGDGGNNIPDIFINEVDADQDSTDSAEFIELFDGDTGNTSLDGLTLVLFNGNGDVSYDAIALDDFTTDSDGFFVVGSDSVPNVDLIEFTTNGIQNGADAVALYQADAADFPNGTAATTDNLLDAIVYDTNDADDTDLLAALGQDIQFNENANGNGTTESNSRVSDGTGDFIAQAPTPGELNEIAPPVVITPIFEIQGDGDNFTSPEYASPLLGQQVTTQGVVTAIADNGFYFQDPTGDDNVDTSDGIFVFTGDSQVAVTTPSVGDLLEVSGTVDEFFQATQIDSVTAVNTISSGNSITPIVLGVDRIAPTEIVDDAGSDDYDVTRDGRDFYESLEGTLVTLPDAVSVSLTRTFAGGSVGEFYAIPDLPEVTTGENDRGGITISEDNSDNPIGADLNPERIQIDNDLGTNSFPTVEVGDRFGNITGVVNYSFNDYAISPINPVTVTTPSNITPETTNLVSSDNQLSIATFNVLNLDPNDSDGDTDVADGKFTALGQQIANNLQAPDIISLQEVQDNNGSVNDGVISADVTLQTLVDEIAAAGGPTYDFIDNPFITDDASGGQPGGNIRVAFLYNSDRVDFQEDSLQPIGDQTEGSPFNGARLPLVADFTFAGEEITVIGNHFSSKGGSDPLFGDEQPPENGSLDERIAQATAVNDFVSQQLASDPDGNIVALGDFNEFQFFEPLEILEQNLTNLTETLPVTERYTFNFEGNSQALDHVLVSSDLADNAQYDTVHINTEFADSPSDHDPAIAQFTFDAPVNNINGTRRDDNIQGTDGNDFIAANNGNDTVDGGDGNDTVEGGRGSDIIRGGAGNDVLAADRVDRFNDFRSEISEIRGNSGNDVLIGGNKRDSLIGGSGNDELLGNSGNDLLRGAAGNDILSGGVGSDRIRGGSGNDTANYSDLVINGVFGTVAGLDANLESGEFQHSSTNNALAWTDTVSGVENVTGTVRNDRFIGNEDNNVFNGRGEIGRSDRRTSFTSLDGQNYTVTADVVEYSGSQSSFTFMGTADNFTASNSTDTDTLIDIEFVRFNEDDTVVATTDLTFV